MITNFKIFENKKFLLSDMIDILKTHNQIKFDEIIKNNYVIDTHFNESLLQYVICNSGFEFVFDLANLIKISNLDHQDKFGNTALHDAVLNKSEDYIIQLIDGGANWNIKNKNNIDFIGLLETHNTIELSKLETMYPEKMETWKMNKNLNNFGI